MKNRKIKTVSVFAFLYFNSVKIGSFLINLYYNADFYQINERNFPLMENPESNAIILGRNLKRLRMERKLTLVDLEVTTGINNGEISKLERGLKNVELITISKLAAALEVDLYELFLPEELVTVVMENVEEYKKKRE